MEVPPMSSLGGNKRLLVGGVMTVTDFGVVPS